MSISPMPPYPGSDAGGQTAEDVEPKPPALHWALLLLIDLVTAAFAFQLSDTDGYASISSAEIVFTGNDGLRCHVLFIRTGAIYLAAQDESVWLGPVAAGSSGTVQHSYCSINGASSSTQGAGNVVTLNLAVQFTSMFAGSRVVVADVYSVNNSHAGNRQVATWSVPGTSPAVPSIVSVTPSSGKGSSQTFAFQLSDTDGYASISSAEIVFTGNDGLRCHVLFVRTGAIYLAAQDESAWLGPVVAGSSGTLQHSYCSVNAASSSTQGSGNVVTLNLMVQFTGAFAGSRIVVADVYSVNNGHPGNRQVATWTVP
ncbi:MAG TPA: hypothetical protein VNY05_27165 [Candidatus Acidoferrales bacterium]|nr:hypothetical protein [Candidatus Acidoferrales bacterium]